jgi:cell division protease FtsH
VGIGFFPTQRGPGEAKQELSTAQLEAIEQQVRTIMEDERQRASGILAENHQLIEALRDLLLDKKVIDTKALGQLTQQHGVSKLPAKSAAVR